MLVLLLLLAQAGQPPAATNAPDPSRPDSTAFFMHMSAMRGETGAIEMMLKMGAEVDSRDKDRKTPLHDACLKGHVETARLLLDHGAKIDARDHDGVTPLHDAALGGHAKMVELLLERKADKDARDSSGLTPLDYAKKMDRTDAVRILQAGNK
jgi:ankyrin repeat protein